MNKTVNINLSGLAFIIDENAFEKLNRYLDTIRKYFNNTEGSEEILSDIEARFAEMFKEKLQNQNEVISITMVDEVIAVMGQPEDFGPEAEDTFAEEPSSSTNSANPGTQSRKKRSKRIYRSGDDKVLGGVCSGIGYYFNIDPVWFRLAFVGSVLFLGSGILLYIILWLIIPEAKSTAEKLEMRGEDVNISNIGKTVKDEFKKVADTISDVADDVSQRIKKNENEQNFVERLISFVFNMVRLIVKFVLKIIAFLFVIISLMVVVTLVLSMIGVTSLLPLQTSLLSFFAGSFLLQILIIASLILFVAIPFIALLYHGLRLLLGIRTGDKPVRSGLGILWLLGVMLAIVTGVMIGNEFSDSAESDSYETINAVDTLYVKINQVEKEINSESGYFLEGDLLINEDADQIILDELDIDIVPTDLDNIKIHIIKKSHGKTLSEASHLASQIIYNYKIDSNELTLDDLIRVSITDSWRDQEVDIELQLPVGTIVYMDEEVKDLVFHSYRHNYGIRKSGKKLHYYEMAEDGLHCIDCEKTTDELQDKIILNDNSRDYGVGDFQNVEIDGFFEIEVRKSDEHRLVIHGSDASLSKIEVKTDDKLLTIEHDWGFLDLFKRNGKVTVLIEAPDLESLETKGASDLDIDGLVQKELDLELNGATDAKIDVELEKLVMELNGAADVRLRGSIGLLESEINGAASMNGRNCQIKVAVLDLSGASDAVLRVEESLTVDASGASSVRYIGNPSVTSDLSGACSINKIK